MVVAVTAAAIAIIDSVVFTIVAFIRTAAVVVSCCQRGRGEGGEGGERVL